MSLLLVPGVRPKQLDEQLETTHHWSVSPTSRTTCHNSHQAHWSSQVDPSLPRILRMDRPMTYNGGIFLPSLGSSDDTQLWTMIRPRAGVGPHLRPSAATPQHTHEAIRLRPWVAFTMAKDRAKHLHQHHKSFRSNVGRGCI